jgi:hypothetical protein
MQVMRCTDCKRVWPVPPAFDQSSEPGATRCEHCGGPTEFARVDTPAGDEPVSGPTDYIEEGWPPVAVPAVPETLANATTADDSFPRPRANSSHSTGMRLRLPRAVSMVAEKWYARRASRELLEWYRRVRDEEPQLSGATLYQQVIVRRSGLDVKAALGILRRAEQSFCAWPSDRDLRFRDVVLYVIIDEYLRSHATDLGTQTNMGNVVARLIPSDL